MLNTLTTNHIDLSEAVLTKLSRHNMPTHPLNYALFYADCAGVNGELTQELESDIKVNGTLPSDRAVELYQKYLQGGSQAEANDGLLHLMSRLDRSIYERSIQSNQLCETLQFILSRIDKIDSKSKIESVATLLLKRAQENIETLESFTTMLEESNNELKHLQQKLQSYERKQVIDPVSGLYNKDIFMGELRSLMAGKERFSAFVVKLDNLNSVSAKYGSVIVDKVIKDIVVRVHRHIPDEARAYRYSDDSIVCLVRDARLLQLKRIADDVYEDCQKLVIKNNLTQKSVTSISISIGMTEIHNLDAESNFLKRLNSALEKASDAGGNTVKFLAA